MPREIVIVSYSARPFKNHWAILVPSTQTPKFGTLIQVEGNVITGFEHSITRNYNLSETRRIITTTMVGTVADKHVHSTPSGGDYFKDKTPKDDVESVAMSVPAPDRSMRSSTGNAGPTTRVQFHDCQWWVTEVIKKLVTQGILDQQAISELDRIPRG